MLQISYIRQNREDVITRLKVKNFGELDIVDDIISTDDELRRIKQETESTQSKIKKLSDEIGMLIRKGSSSEAEAKKKEVEPLKSLLTESQEKLNKLEQRLNDLIVKLPNLPSGKVPGGRTPDDNVTVREGGSIPQLQKNAMPHWDLAKNIVSSTLNWAIRLPAAASPFTPAREPDCSAP